MPKTLMRRGVGDVEPALRSRPRHLPVDQAQELEPGVDARQVRPAPTPGRSRAGRRAACVCCAKRSVSSKARSSRPDEQSVTRSWFSWLVISFQPLFSPPTRFSAGTRTSSKKTVLMSCSESRCSGSIADARRLHVDDEASRCPRASAASGSVRTASQTVVGVAGEARPDLLAVDHVLVAVAHGARRERREVGAGVRLGVADAEVDLAREDLRQEEALLLLACRSA